MPGTCANSWNHSAGEFEYRADARRRTQRQAPWSQRGATEGPTERRRKNKRRTRATQEEHKRAPPNLLAVTSHVPGFGVALGGSALPFCILHSAFCLRLVVAFSPYRSGCLGDPPTPVAGGGQTTSQPPHRPLGVPGSGSGSPLLLRARCTKRSRRMALPGDGREPVSLHLKPGPVKRTSPDLISRQG